MSSNLRMSFRVVFPVEPTGSERLSPPKLMFMSSSLFAKSYLESMHEISPNNASVPADALINKFFMNKNYLRSRFQNNFSIRAAKIVKRM